MKVCRKNAIRNYEKNGTRVKNRDGSWPVVVHHRELEGVTRIEVNVSGAGMGDGAELLFAHVRPSTGTSSNVLPRQSPNTNGRIILRRRARENIYQRIVVIVPFCSYAIHVIYSYDFGVIVIYGGQEPCTSPPDSKRNKRNRFYIMYLRRPDDRNNNVTKKKRRQNIVDTTHIDGFAIMYRTESSFNEMTYI